MSFNFNKIKSLFVVTEEAEQSPKQQKQQKQDDTKEAPKKQPVVKPRGTASKRGSDIVSDDEPRQGRVNQKIYDSLIKAISEANLPGEDYLEFMDALNAMKSLPLDESTKIQTVLATLSTKGLSKEKIISSAQHYLKVLQDEKSKFNAALKDQTDGKINRKKNEIDELEAANEKKSQQIMLLTEEIKKQQEEIIRLKNEIQNAEAKIASTVSDFETTYNSVANQIVNNVEKVKALQK